MENNRVKHIALLTSGGDSPGMNATIRAVVRACAYYKVKCTGIYQGYQGLLNKDFKPLNARSVRNIINKGGTFLKSTRAAEFETKEGRKKAFTNLKNHHINALVVIGGNGSLLGAKALHEEFDFPVVGIPATIDNDVNGTDYSIGYDTALNTVIEAIDKIRDTAHSHNRLFLVEVMGRNSGDIGLNTGIGAGAEEILIPEKNMGIDRLVKSLKRSKKSGKTSSIIVVSEGEKTGKNTFELADYIQKHLKDYEVRVTVLGHIQRGGTPGCYDRVLGSRMGVKAVETLVNNNKSGMIGIQHKDLVLRSFKNSISAKNTLDQNLLHIADITSI